MITGIACRRGACGGVRGSRALRWGTELPAARVRVILSQHYGLGGRGYGRLLRTNQRSHTARTSAARRAHGRLDSLDLNDTIRAMCTVSPYAS